MDPFLKTVIIISAALLIALTATYMIFPPEKYEPQEEYQIETEKVAVFVAEWKNNCRIIADDPGITSVRLKTICAMWLEQTIPRGVTP